MLSKIVFAAAPAAALFASAAVAGDAPKARFVHEGYTYVYQVKEDNKGASRISGNRYPGGAAFSLVVRDGKVNGVSGGQSVAFNVEAARGAAAGAKAVAN
ncbi:hypothetical protein PX699_13970 [Sphingobium sp. H39-3-25]|nr:hypothetical protein [Sphingobium arseniciresistens]